MPTIQVGFEFNFMLLNHIASLRLTSGFPIILKAISYIFYLCCFSFVSTLAVALLPTWCHYLPMIDKP